MLLKPAPTKQFLDALEKIKSETVEIYRWAETHVVGDDIFPRYLPKELGDIFSKLSSRFDDLESQIKSLEGEETQLIYRILVKCQRAEKLSEEEFYLCRAIGDLKPKSQNESEYEAYLKGFA
jgi:hypothetical protein